MEKITAIIVTYNRKFELYRCIQAVLFQTYKVCSLLIVDNASSDNTFDFIYEKIYNCDNDKILKICANELLSLPPIHDANIFYLLMNENTGGAGGFHAGLKTANEVLHSEYFWLMDDDGYPSDNCLEKQLSLTGQYDYIMPVSINPENHTELSWPARKRNKRRTIYYDELKQSWGAVMNYVTPFNGALLSKSCVDSVGYVNKDFFIWGDDYEHYWRCKKNNVNPVTLMDAVFYHPAQKISLVSVCFNLFKLPYVESKLRMVCLVRNSTYIYLHYDKKFMIIIKFFMYTWLFLITRKFDMSGYKLYLQSVLDAFNGNFTRHLKYL
ncbi:hypothetical protein FACS1894163_06950 [Spirochaetia bacterium]|nr:hypothetical protein FACS1894163_06950 [Spirochaetia bacterium]